MKKTISIFLLLAMLVGILPGVLPLSGEAAALKDGYTLVPTLYSTTGVDVSSSFILTTPDESSLEEVIDSMSIDGQPMPDIAHSGAKEFTITPVMALTSNSLYVFRLQREGKPDISWAFQTAKKFQITSSYPHNEATNVPRNSGIEITFSDAGYTPIDMFFSISPNVKGRFEYHKTTAVFVPDRLAYRTVYTVTIKAGIKLEATGEQLLTDYVFAFETEPEPEYKPPQKVYYEYMNFSSTYIELPTLEAPSFGYRIYRTSGYPMPNPRVNVYKFGSNESAVEAIRKLRNVPGWAWYAAQDYRVSTTGLRSVMSFGALDYYDIDNGMLSLPDKLSQGFYLIDSTLGDLHEQMVIQINDLPVQVIADNTQTLVWVNDIGAGGASASATVHDAKNGRTYKANSDGVAVIDRALESDGSEQLTVTSLNGKTCVWLYTPVYNYYYYGGYWGYGGGSEAYWTALQLDRTLFKRDDTVSFFGFVQDRRNNEEIANVTAVLTMGYGYGRYGSIDVLHKQVVPVQNGTYSDEIALPNLDTGYYCLTVYHGDIVLGSTYFQVKDYVKPPYKIDVAVDKKAVFADDTVTFTATAGFFEGTPVSNLDVSYRLSGYGLQTVGNGQGTTDIDGGVTVSQKIVPQENTQGQTALFFTVEATLPEIGRTTKSAYVRAFINDINVRAQATREKANASLTVDVNAITLDRLNNGTARHYYDYLDAPVAGKTMSVEIYRVYYEKTQTGSYYDYINKRSVPTYQYSHREQVIDNFNIVTDGNGTANKQFTVPDRLYESYFARVKCVDGNGRTITQNVYIGRDYSYYYDYANTNDYYLDGVEDCYDIGEEVSLLLKRGTDTVTAGNFLFVDMQRGIQSYQAGRNPYIFKFGEQHIPNIYVYAYYFDGYRYQSSYNMRTVIRFDYSKNDLTLTAVTDQDSYKPGDMCSIIVTAEDRNGNPKIASVNVSIVDEALFALQDYNVYTLASLYRTLSAGLKFAVATHRTYSYSEDIAVPGGPPLADAEMEAAEDGGGDGDDTYLREVFKDTAFFDTIRTDETGQAVYAFKLPDNITSWRLTISGISNDLYAGNAVQNIIVTMPMFLSYSLNDEFLLGDTPTIGVNVYGTGLTGGEVVNFEVWDENRPSVRYKASGAAFERVDIPLWEMKTEGANALIIKASIAGVASDAVKHQYQVLKTYREIDEAVYYDVTTGTQFAVGSGGITNITFTDRSRGQFLYQLIGMRYAYGDRIERMLVRREANKLLTEYFPDLVLYRSPGRVDFKTYQRNDGGIAILPYAGSDLVTTVKTMPYIKDEVDINALRSYLYDIYTGENQENKMCALYGLAMLREPVLLDLDNYSLLDDISVKDAVYIALGYYALGETETASELYSSRIAPRLERMAPYYRVNTGVDNDDILDATAAANLLAAKLEKPEREGLYQYCIRNYTTDILINIEKLSYIEHEITRRTSDSGKITYTLYGDRYTREMKNGSSYTLRIPAQRMGEFKLIEVSGDVGAVSTFKKPLTEIGEVDNEITVRRRYYKANDPSNSTNSFEQGDLVRVHIWIDYSAKAVNGSYCVTDYLPAGLKYVSNSAKIDGTADFGCGYFRYCTAEGQKITFYDYNGRFNRGYLYYYYARVISPGTFTAEGPIVQNLTAKDCITVGESSTVVIR